MNHGKKYGAMEKKSAPFFLILDTNAKEFILEMNLEILDADDEMEKLCKKLDVLFLRELKPPSSCRAASMDIPDSLSPLLPIIHRLWQVFRATSHILIAAVCMYVRAGRPAFARPYVGVHRSTSLMSSSL